MLSQKWKGGGDNQSRLVWVCGILKRCFLCIFMFRHALRVRNCDAFCFLHLHRLVHLKRWGQVVTNQQPRVRFFSISLFKAYSLGISNFHVVKLDTGVKKKSWNLYKTLFYDRFFFLLLIKNRMEKSKTDTEILSRIKKNKNVYFKSKTLKRFALSHHSLFWRS